MKSVAALKLSFVFFVMVSSAIALMVSSVESTALVMTSMSVPINQCIIVQAW